MRNLYNAIIRLILFNLELIFQPIGRLCSGHAITSIDGLCKGRSCAVPHEMFDQCYKRLIHYFRDGKHLPFVEGSRPMQSIHWELSALLPSNPQAFSEHLAYPLYSFCKNVNLLFGVVQSEGCPDST